MRKFAAALLAAPLMTVIVATAAPADEAATPADAPSPAAPSPAAPSPAAMDFVEQFADDHLSGMLSRIGGQSEPMRLLSHVDGRLLAAAFDAEIDAAVERHGEAWAHNLALAWSPLLSDAEMASLAEKGPDSPYAPKYLDERNHAAAEMAQLSDSLFRRILTEVIGNTVRALTPEAPAR